MAILSVEVYPGDGARVRRSQPLRDSWMVSYVAAIP